MRKISLSLILSAAFLGILPMASPASAQATRTWVSGVGDDANPCSRTAPCKTFAGAISKTAAGGEINVIDAGAQIAREGADRRAAHSDDADGLDQMEVAGMQAGKRDVLQRNRIALIMRDHHVAVLVVGGVKKDRRSVGENGVVDLNDVLTGLEIGDRVPSKIGCEYEGIAATTAHHNVIGR